MNDGKVDAARYWELHEVAEKLILKAAYGSSLTRTAIEVLRFIDPSTYDELNHHSC